MRKLASFDDRAFAEDLREVLFANDIATELRSEADDNHLLWIVDENETDRARAMIEAYARDPDNPRYRDVRELARQKRIALSQRDRGSRHRVIEVRKTFRERATQSPVTFALLGACIVIAFATNAGSRLDLVSALSIVSFDRVGGLVRWDGYQDLLHGELWRLFTPILLHFGPLHLLFNAFWLNDLGAATERYQGSWRYSLFMFWSAAISNLAQLYFGGGPNFGGLSGVIYALVGYLWARGRFDPRSGIALPNRMVGFFMVWLALGFTGLLTELVGRIANYCHLGGFAAGVLYGYIAARIAVRRA